MTVDNETAKWVIAKNLRGLMAARTPPWSQAELARAAGESRMTICHLVHGKRLGSVALIQRIADVFGTTVEALMTPQVDGDRPW